MGNSKSYSRVLQKIFEIFAEEKYTASEAKTVLATAERGIDNLSVMQKPIVNYADEDFTFD